MKLRILLVIVSILNVGTANAAGIEVSLPQFETVRVATPPASASFGTKSATSENSAESETLKVGDAVTFLIKGAHSSELHAVFDDKKESLEDQGWALLESKSPTSVAEGSNSSDNSDLKVLAIPLKPGKIIFPSLAIQDSTGKEIGRSAPVTVDIASAISPSDPKPTQPEDVQPPVGLQFPFWIILLAGVVAVFLVAALGYCIYRAFQEYLKRRKKPEVVLSEDEYALAELEKLVALEFLEKGHFKQFYFRVSEILKKYLGQRYEFDAPESTTGEILTTLKGLAPALIQVSPLPSDRIEELALLFEKLDRVKFTDHIPEAEEGAQILAHTKEFIVNTRRVPLVINSPGVENHAVQ